MVVGVLVVSLLLQVAAVLLALRLIPVTRARTAWVLIAAAIGLMAIRRAITLWRLASGDTQLSPDPAVEVVALAISVLMFAGIALIRGVFDAHRRAEADLRKSEAARRDLEVQLLQAQKMEALGRLAGGVAHDFNNVLTAIVGCTELTLAALPADHPQRHLLQDVLTAAQRAGALSKRLLAFSRRQPVQIVDVDPNECLRSVCTVLRRLIPQNIHLDVRPGEGLCTVRGDAGQLEQVLLNLAINARDAMPDGGTLTIETALSEVTSQRLPTGTTLTPGTYLAITVRDTGVGMDDSTRARLFEPYFTTKEAGRGTGLGLATVYGIVNQLGGFLEVTTALGKGSALVALLPRSDTARAAPADEARARALTTSEPLGTGILVVEDDDVIRDLVRSVLVQRGYEVTAVGEAESALEVARDRTVRLDLLLTDSVMPGLSGSELAKRVLTTRPGLRVVLMSGYLAEAESPFPFLVKPFAVHELLACVERELASPTVSASTADPRRT